MKVKRIVADNMQQALRQVSQLLGPDAVIVSSKKLEKGIEVVAALDLTDHADPGQQQEMDRQVNLQRELDQARRDMHRSLHYNFSQHAIAPLKGAAFALAQARRRGSPLVPTVR